MNVSVKTEDLNLTFPEALKGQLQQIWDMIEQLPILQDAAQTILLERKRYLIYLDYILKRFSVPEEIIDNVSSEMSERSGEHADLLKNMAMDLVRSIRVDFHRISGLLLMAGAIVVSTGAQLLYSTCKSRLYGELVVMWITEPPFFLPS